MGFLRNFQEYDHEVAKVVWWWVVRILSLRILGRACLLAQYAIQKGKTPVSMALLPFDIVEGKYLQAEGKGGLGDILVNAIWSADYVLAEAIFAHPKAKEIPADTSYGLGSALLAAIEMGNSEMAQKILAQPNATKIATEGPFGIDAAITRAKEKEMDDVIEILKSFQKTND